MTETMSVPFGMSVDAAATSPFHVAYNTQTSDSLHNTNSAPSTFSTTPTKARWHGHAGDGHAAHMDANHASPYTSQYTESVSQLSFQSSTQFTTPSPGAKRSGGHASHSQHSLHGWPGTSRHQQHHGVSGSVPFPPTPVRRAKRQCPFDDASPLQLKQQVWERPQEDVAASATLDRLMAAQREKQLAPPPLHGGDGLPPSATRCIICQSFHTDQAPCGFCGKLTCRSCSRECEECHDTFCSYCSTINYDLRYDRCFCLECNEEHR